VKGKKKTNKQTHNKHVTNKQTNKHNTKQTRNRTNIMPIDLKWVRTNPELVQEWQDQRGLGNKDAQHDQQGQKQSVQQVLQCDESCRQVLQDLNRQRTTLEKLQQSLRPTSKKQTTTEASETEAAAAAAAVTARLLKTQVVSDIQDLQESIRQTQLEWKLATQQTQRALYQLASPVDDQVVVIESSSSHDDDDDKAFLYHKCQQKEQQQQYPNELPFPKKNTKRRRQRHKRPTYDFSCHLGLDVAQAVLHYARRQFGQYSITSLDPCPGVLPNTSTSTNTNSNTGSLDADLAHAMWGCTAGTTANDCHICSTLSSSASSASSFSPLPAWLRLVAHQIPHKSIWGAKQLPQYTTAMVNNNNNNNKSETGTFEILAMTSGTLWDSRSVQKELVDEVLDFYKSLLRLTTLSSSKSGSGSSSSTLTTYAVSAKELQRHELSRIVIAIAITIQDDDDDGGSSRMMIPLGWVSNFGDAASRACELTFAGGGHQKKKDYVHFVQATVLGPDTVAGLLYANTCNNGDKVALPNCLLFYLVMNDNNNDKEVGMDEDRDFLWIPLASLTQTDAMPLAPATKPSKTLWNGSRSSSRRCRQDTNTTKLPLLDVTSRPSPEQIRAEAATCPFDFLFP
jgi:hypothetical protein